MKRNDSTISKIHTYFWVLITTLPIYIPVPAQIDRNSSNSFRKIRSCVRYKFCEKRSFFASKKVCSTLVQLLPWMNSRCLVKIGKSRMFEFEYFQSFLTAIFKKKKLQPHFLKDNITVLENVSKKWLTSLPKMRLILMISKQCEIDCIFSFCLWSRDNLDGKLHLLCALLP